MKTIIAAGVVTFFAIAASAVPAQAGSGVTFGFGGGHGHHGGHWNGHNSGVTFEFNTRPHYRNSWRQHVRWCFNHHDVYDPDTNRYFNGHRWRHCNSPFS